MNAKIILKSIAKNPYEESYHYLVVPEGLSKKEIEKIVFDEIYLKRYVNPGEYLYTVDFYIDHLKHDYFFKDSEDGTRYYLYRVDD